MPRDGDSSAAVMLLEKLRQNSEFLISQRNDLVDVWDKINLYSFYEKVKTPVAVQVELNISSLNFIIDLSKAKSSRPLRDSVNQKRKQKKRFKKCLHDYLCQEKLQSASQKPTQK